MLELNLEFEDAYSFSRSEKFNPNLWQVNKYLQTKTFFLYIITH